MKQSRPFPARAVVAALPHFLLGALLLPQTTPTSTPAPAITSTPTSVPTPTTVPQPVSWYFAVSGDSRDCGDLIMRKIARSIELLRATAPVSFFWHLGDFRNGKKADRDFVLLNGGDDGYHHHAWDDFLARQIAPLEAQTQVFLGIGNHELVFPFWSHDEFREKFGKYLLQEPIRIQNVADRAAQIRRDEHHIDYHFVKNGVDFICLDNSDTYAFTPEYLLHPAFTPNQIRWLEGVLEGDAGNPAVKAIVVAMHAALPGSSASNHAMDDTCHGRASGQTVYDMLYKAQALSGPPERRKRVYVLASHSHDYAENVFEKGHPGKVLPGWIIGTAGAAQHDIPIRYGYLLFEVRPDATLKATFKEITRDSQPLPSTQAERDLTDFCYTQNVEAAHRMRSLNCGTPGER